MLLPDRGECLESCNDNIMLLKMLDSFPIVAVVDVYIECVALNMPARYERRRRKYDAQERN